MREESIKFETAKLAKEKGFNIDNGNCFDEKENHYSWDMVTWFNESENKHLQFDETLNPIYYRPTQSLLQKWLRETENIHIEIRNHENKWYWELKTVIHNSDFSVILNSANKNKELGWSKIELNSYEEALEIGLQEALKLIEIDTVL